LGEHEKALNLLINDLKDYNGAEIYCIYGGDIIGFANKTSKRLADKKIKGDKNILNTRKSLFLTLLKVYLENG